MIWKTVLFTMLIALVSISCDERLEKIDIKESSTRCSLAKIGSTRMDYWINKDNFECECPDSNYYFNTADTSIAELIQEAIPVCKRSYGLSYLLVSECPCTDATFDRDSIVITFDNSIGTQYRDTAETFFSFMVGRIGLNQPYYETLEDGNIWGSDSIKANYSVLSYDRTFRYECSQYGDDVHGEVHGKFNPSDSLSIAWVKWYDTNDQLIDSCKWTLMK